MQSSELLGDWMCAYTESKWQATTDIGSTESNTEPFWLTKTALPGTASAVEMLIEFPHKSCRLWRLSASQED